MNRRLLTLFIIVWSANASPIVAETIGTDTLDHVVVTGTRHATDSRHLPLNVTTINRPTLTQDYQLNVIPAVTTHTPGLFATSRGVVGYGVSTGAAGTMKVRGIGSGAQFLVLIDGQPQYAGLMGHPIPDAYQTLMAEKAEIVRGPASVLYGSNAMGGVLNIVTRQMQQDGQQTHINLGAGSYGTIQAEVSNQARKGRFSSVAGVNYQRTNGHRPNSQFEQVNGFVKLGLEITENWKASSDVEITHFSASNPGPQNAPMLDNDQKITRGLASMSLQNRYEKTSGVLRGYFDWGYHKINDGHTADAPAKTYLYKHNDYIGGLSWYQSASLFTGNTVTVGVDWQHFGGRAWNAYLDGTTPNAWLTNSAEGKHLLTEDEVGAYIDIRQEVSHWLSVDAGLRYDWHSQAGGNWIPQGGLSVHVSRQDDVKALVSKGFRNPTLRELYMFRPANDQLKAEQMVNYELSYTHRLPENKGHLAASLFLIKGDNLINTIYSQQLGRMTNVNTGAFTHYGFELEGDYRLSSHWQLNANYSYLHMHKPVEGAPESKFYLGATYRVRHLVFHGGLQQVAGLYLATGDAPEKENYTLLNLTATYQVLPQLSLWVRGENLTAERYQTYQGFPMPKATVMAGINVKL